MHGYGNVMKIGIILCGIYLKHISSAPLPRQEALVPREIKQNPVNHVVHKCTKPPCMRRKNVQNAAFTNGWLARTRRRRYQYGNYYDYTYDTDDYEDKIPERSAWEKLPWQKKVATILLILLSTLGCCCCYCCCKCICFLFRHCCIDCKSNFIDCLDILRCRDRRYRFLCRTMRHLGIDPPTYKMWKSFKDEISDMRDVKFGSI